ncbi:Sugar transferase involved in LPS biosynthesis (colanic, teichoic acid) [Cnuella takakiae]|uniref:Sugar transferase involved in LPS biosynthesis (Colanic, teichoic acid) n=1 Tax=Cnuella takakiae TaxID=1302690 RepID=A0A1M5CJG0_9BACT|nr:sugar transferase [Cnuella takakiae]OLY91849.1 hypothetical protein BUE76_08005 [Cnuella takakiae]SHF54840.1 Sugar transferase involved in LPS biosynthesis (colanic, teichoic acid) [Cnuella takakiae]
MQVEAFPTEVFDSKFQEIKVKKHLFSKSKLQTYHIYLGNNHHSWSYNNPSFSEAVVFKSYDDVVNHLISYPARLQFAIPLSIIIDLPLDFQGMERLHMALKSNLQLSSVVVVYNQRFLARNQEIILQNLEIVNIIVDFERDCLNGALSSYKKSSDIGRIKAFNSIQKIHSSEYLANMGLMLKTFCDSLVAAIIIALLLPLFIIIGIAIKIDSRGPIFYASPRAGRGYKVFNFYKFRSMVVDADKKIEILEQNNQYRVEGVGPKFFKVDNDPRITKLGRFLRKTSLDELPQLFNVLKGEMSLVGNRPLPLYEAETLTTDNYVERFMAPAGITGLWQVEKRGKAEMSIEERIELDITYARKVSPLMDMRILVKTPFALVQKSDA